MDAPKRFNDPYYDLIDKATTAKLGLPDGLLQSIRVNGERTNADRVSPAGAKTVYQIIPATRDAILKKYGIDAYLSPRNASIASGYVLKEGLDRNGGNALSATAEYHAGTNPKNHGPITRSYVSRVMSAINPIGTAYAGEETPEQLIAAYDEWKAKTGVDAKTPSEDVTPVDPETPSEDSATTDDTETPDQLIAAYDDYKKRTTQEQANPPANPDEQTPTGLMDMAGQAISNTPESLVKNAGQLANAVMHPIDTISTLADVAGGAVENQLGDKGTKLLTDIIPWQSDTRSTYHALVDDYAKAYGGIDNLKRTIAHDPIRALMDFSVFAEGASGAAKAAGLTRTADIAGQAADIVNPINAVGKAAAKASELPVDILGTTTGAGGEAIKQATKAGFKGGAAQEAFIRHANGTGDIMEIVPMAKDAIQTLRSKAFDVYRQKMAQVGQSSEIIPFTDIEQAVNDSLKFGKYKDFVKNKSASGVHAQIQSVLDEFKALPSDEYHTAMGFDALKQAIGDIRDTTEYRSPSRAVADAAYHAVKSEIVKKAPIYADAMQGVEKMYTQVRELEKGLSIGEKSSVMTSVRNMQQALRNNVNTGFGHKLTMAKVLEDNGATELLPSLAGQSLHSWTPRGIQGAIMAGQAGYGIANPATLLVLPFQLPKLIGNIANTVGRAGNIIDKTPQIIKDTGLTAAQRLANQRNLAAIATAAQRAQDNQKEKK